MNQSQVYMLACYVTDDCTHGNDIICWQKLIRVVKNGRLQKYLAVESFIMCYCNKYLLLALYSLLLMSDQLTAYSYFNKLKFYALRTFCSF